MVFMPILYVRVMLLYLTISLITLYSYSGLRCDSSMLCFIYMVTTVSMAFINGNCDLLSSTTKMLSKLIGQDFKLDLVGQMNGYGNYYNKYCCTINGVDYYNSYSSGSLYEQDAQMRRYCIVTYLSSGLGNNVDKDTHNNIASVFCVSVIVGVLLCIAFN